MTAAAAAAVVAAAGVSCNSLLVNNEITSKTVGPAVMEGEDPPNQSNVASSTTKLNWLYTRYEAQTCFIQLQMRRFPYSAGAAACQLPCIWKEGRGCHARDAIKAYGAKRSASVTGYRPC